MRIYQTTAILLISLWGYTQTITLGAGSVLSSTVWDIGIENTAYTQSILESKYGTSAFIGIEYLQMEKTKLSTSIGFYQGGGQLAIFEHKEARPLIRWDLENNKYNMNVLSLNNNLNFTIFNQNKGHFDAIVGLNIRLIVESKKQDIMENGTYFDPTSPIQTLYMYNSLNRINFGFNAGIRYRWDFDNFSLGIQHLYSPTFRKLASKAHNSDPLGIALDVEEKTSFTQIIFGYKL